MVTTQRELKTSNKAVVKLTRHIERHKKGELTDSLIFMQSLHNGTKALSESFSKVSVCTKGCSHCCKLNVDLTLVEALYIKSKLKGDNVALRYSAGFESGTFCPFHNEATKACNIYEFRPIACQLFASVDSAEYCKTPDVAHEVLTQHSISAFEDLVRPLEDAGRLHPEYPVYADIREWFEVKK